MMNKNRNENKFKRGPLDFGGTNMDFCNEGGGLFVAGEERKIVGYASSSVTMIVTDFTTATPREATISVYF